MGDTEDHSTEGELIKRILSGETGEFSVFVRNYQNYIISLIYRQVGDKEIAQELSQETFIRAFERLKTFRGEAKFETWLTKIALNITNSFFSSKRFKQKSCSVPFDPSCHGGKLDERDIENVEQRITLLQSFIGMLTPKYREVIVLAALENKDYKEVAEILGIPIGTVSSRMNRALNELREKFDIVKIKSKAEAA